MYFRALVPALLGLVAITLITGCSVRAKTESQNSAAALSESQKALFEESEPLATGGDLVLNHSSAAPAPHC